MENVQIDFKPVEIDHVDIAILLKVNELAACYGIKPHQFGISYFRSSGSSKHAALSLDTVDQEVEAKSFRMLDALGLDGENTRIEGTVGAIFDALNAAITRSPHRRHRRG